MEIKINGVSAVAAELEMKISGMADKIARGVALAGELVKDEAKALAPVDTTRLQKSITSQAAGNTAVIGTNVEYAMYQEFGTHKMRAHPYLVPALINNADRVREIIKTEVKK